MKENLEKYFYIAIKYIVHIAVVLISTLLTVNLLMGLSNNPVFKIFWIIMGLAVEGGGIYCFIMAKALWKANKIPQFAIYIIAYLGLTSISLISNTGFSLMSIESQSRQTEVQNSVSDTSLLDRQIAQLEDENRVLKLDREDAIQQKNEMPIDWLSYRATLRKAIDDFTTTISENNDELNALYLSKQSSTSTDAEVVASSSDIFTALGNGWLEGHKVMLYLMLFMSLMVELLKAITAGNMSLDDKKKEVKEVVVEKVEERIIPKPENTFRFTLDIEAIFKYIDCLMENGMEKLKQDQIISDELNMPLAHCKQFRKQLLSMSYDNTPILVSKRGVGTRASFPKKTIKKLIEIDSKLDRK